MCLRKVNRAAVGSETIRYGTPQKYYRRSYGLDSGIIYALSDVARQISSNR